MDTVAMTPNASASLPEMVRQVLHAAPAPLTFTGVKAALKKAGVKAGKGKVSDTEILRELEAPGVHPHPAARGKPKYWHRPPESAAERVATVVRAKVAALGDTPVTASKLGKPSGKSPKPEVIAAFEHAVRELVAEGKLFEYPGRKYGKLPPQPPTVEYPDRELREVYVLDVFARAANQMIPKADIEWAFPGKGKPDKKTLAAKYPDVVRLRGQECFEMGAPATRQALQQLVADDYLSLTEGDEAYTLTAAGAERLKDIRDEFPVLPPVGNPETPDDAAMRELWEVFVLLKLVEADEYSLAEPAVYKVGYPKGSKLNDATAWKLRGELASAGYVTAKWTGHDGEYTLTPKGLQHLAGLSFEGFDKIEVKGSALTALLTAARGGAKEAVAPPDQSTEATVPPPDLEAAVMRIFRQVHTERFNNKQMVPIHEVRAEVRHQMGPEAASHAVFDRTVNELRRKGQVRLVPISDRSSATEQELRESIDSAVGILFYLEKADANSES